MSGRLLTAEEVAERLGVPARWPLAQARAGHMPCVRLGRYVRFDADDVDAWIASLKTGGGPAFRRYQPKGGS